MGTNGFFETQETLRHLFGQAGDIRWAYIRSLIW